MRSIFTILLCSAFLSACGGSDNDSSPASNTDHDLNPTSTQAETPPTGTTLPADLRPPH